MDPRILQALQLLHSALGLDANASQGPRLLPEATLEHPPDLSHASATDLLTMWLPERQLAGAAERWDALFGAGAPVQPLPFAELGASHAPPRTTLRGSEPPSSELLSERDEHRLDTSHADAVVDCLFAFVHALGRRDLETALAEVSASFHAVEFPSARRSGGELHRRELRQRLEQLLDLRTQEDLDVSLVRIPEVIGHPCGALVHNTIQLDMRAPDGGPADTRLWEVVLLFCPSASGRWQIHSLTLFTEV
ncbi:MAG: hypothetical protein R6X02_09305 [Enhygromyxa sp.]